MPAARASNPASSAGFGDLLARVQEADGDVVGHGRPREAHPAAQHVGQHRARRRDRHAVELRVARHHRREPGEPECGLEGTGVDVVELARADGGRRHVLAAFGHRVADEVLRGRQHALGQVVALQSARVGDAHGAHEVGILSVGLAHPPPTGIAGHVHDGRQRLELAHRPHLAPDDVGHLLHRRGVPRRREPDRGGELP